MNRFHLAVGLLIVGCLGLVVAAGSGWFSNANEPIRIAEKTPVENKPDKKPQRVPSDDEIKIGGVIRPKTDVVAPIRDNQDVSERQPLFNVGHTPSIDPEESVYTKSVYSAAMNPDEKLGHRLTPLQPAPKFDPEEYSKDPESYLNEVAPGRIFDVLPYSKETPRIRRGGKARFQVLQGESAVIRAESEKGMPVSFYSSRLGRFNGGLSAITVAADDNGVAEVTFQTTPGMFGDVDIVATSPVRSGKARYVVEVRLPDDKIRKN